MDGESVRNADTARTAAATLKEITATHVNAGHSRRAVGGTGAS